MPITASCGHTLTEEEDLGTPVFSIVYEYSWGMQCGDYCDKCAEEMLYSGMSFSTEEECWEELQRYLKEDKA